MADAMYIGLLAAADRLIGEKGKPAQIIRNTRSGPAYEPQLTPTTYNVKFVEVGYSMTNRSETLIQQGDVLGLVSMDGEVAVLQMDDIFIPDIESGKQYRMVDVQPLNPGGVQLLTEIHARG